MDQFTRSVAIKYEALTNDVIVMQLVEATLPSSSFKHDSSKLTTFFRNPVSSETTNQGHLSSIQLATHKAVFRMRGLDLSCIAFTTNGK